MSLWTNFAELLQNGILFFGQVFGGNMGTAIITFSLFLRLLILPLTLKIAERSFIRQKIMKELQPELEKLKKRFRKQPEILARATMEMYKKHNISMIDSFSFLGGLVQLPVFFGLFSAVRRILVNFGSRFLWIRNIALPDLKLTLFVTVLTYIMVSLSPNLSGQYKLLMILLPTALSFFFLWHMAAGIGLYWASTSAVGILQIAIIRYRRK